MFCQDNYIKALRYASKIHAKQVTFEELPYLTHVVGVTAEVIHACIQSQMEDEKTNFAISVSLLHDAIEKTKVTYDDIFDKFGLEVAEGVEALSKNYELEKKEQFKDNMERLLCQPYEIQMIKLADRINNLCIEPKNWDEDEIISYVKESKLIYSCLRNSNIYLSSRLNEKISKFEDYLESK